jgi:hypothetical protein
MLLAPFTLHKVQNTSVVSDLDGKKILHGFHWQLAILQNLDGGIQMVKGHYFKIVSTTYSSNWNSIRPKRKMCVYCHPTDPIFFTPTLKLFIGNFLISWKFCLFLEPNGIISPITVESVFKNITNDNS